MCGIFLITSQEFTLFRLNNDGSTGSKLFHTRASLQEASYVVLSNNGAPIPVHITSESAPRRIPTKDSTAKLTLRKEKFKQRVRDRDNHCVISGIPNISGDDFTMFAAAHIFPYAREQTWVEQNFSRWITDEASPHHQGLTKIHSVQNGLLLAHHVHSWFDEYRVTVNVDDNYKIICLLPDPISINGRTLDPRCHNPQNPDRVSDQLLRWHHRQAVLAHMKGAGQKAWETDFGDGSDMMGEILEGPDAAERMEVELFTRLGAGELHYSKSPEVSSGTSSR
ncbi:hypothetical protein V492_03376 [Pseudogymnoascus sp. VKM F-4246]|nr:hypothetical protein V492_03376 [Pseudogymnoascus sp. VKM F-4246]